MQRVPASAAALLAIVLAVLALWPRSPNAPKVTASWTRTPGVLNPDVRQETIGRTICVSGWTRTIRPAVDYTSRLKERQLAEYGLAGDPAGYQEDHLISLELGGDPRDPRNLWPEPKKRALAVDRIENQLHADLCAGRLTLAEAQRRISDVKHRSG
jgi:hypothetical protein